MIRDVQPRVDVKRFGVCEPGRRSADVTSGNPLETGAAVLDQGQANARVQIGGLAGDYRIRLTVRNAAGQQDSTIVTVRFRSTTIP